MTQLDLTFICDTTGSMGSYIAAAKKNIQTIVTKIIQFEKADVRFALVEYKDHPPQDRDFNVRLTPFTSSLKEMQTAVDQMHATGGGDTPESICCAFHTAANLDWREDATKIIIWIADAPPHGFMRHGDGFPEGCPCGHDTIREVRNCVNKDIVIYSVGAEPLSVEYLRTLMRAVSQLTGGQYVALSSADLLSELIINGCREEIQMKRVVLDVRRRLEASPDFATLSPAEKQQRINREVEEQTRDMQIDTVVIESIFRGELPTVPDIFLTCQSLAELKAGMYAEGDIAVEFNNAQGYSIGSIPYEYDADDLLDDSLDSCAGLFDDLVECCDVDYEGFCGVNYEECEELCEVAPTRHRHIREEKKCDGRRRLAEEKDIKKGKKKKERSECEKKKGGSSSRPLYEASIAPRVMEAPPMQTVTSERRGVSLEQQDRLKSRLTHFYTDTLDG